MDILTWLVNSEAKKIASFGSLAHFKPECAPNGATLRCVDCKVENCQYNALKAYLPVRGGWPATVIGTDQTEAGLKEALKTQSPKAVVLDTYMLYYFQDAITENQLNCSESAIRKAADNMRLSKNKLDFIRDIVSFDDSQSGLSFVLKNIRYHNRWTSLTENDFNIAKMEKHGAIKGFASAWYTTPQFEYEPFKAGDSNERVDMLPVMEEYLNRIEVLCKEKSIPLVLTCIPMGENIEKYNTNKLYADEHGLDYYDFNEYALYNELNYDAKEDALSHPNVWGAAKLSNKMGEILATKYGIKSQPDDSFDISRNNYAHLLYNCELMTEEDPTEYLNKINSELYNVYIFGRNGMDNLSDDKVYAAIESLGFVQDLRSIPYKYYFGFKDSEIIENVYEYGAFSDSGSLRGGLSEYKISATPYTSGFINTSFMIDQEEYFDYSDGIHIIVYDLDNKNVLDKVIISEGEGEATLSRY